MESSIKIITHNRKASFNYFLSDFMEAGIVLTGTEIKSIRNNGLSLNDCYIVIRNDEAFIIGMHISPYKEGNIFNQDPLRTRKLLLHKKEIRRLSAKVKEKSFTLVPTKVYFKNGRVKIEIALGKGKKNFDKRDSEKEKDQKRAIDKAMKSYD